MKGKSAIVNGENIMHHEKIDSSSVLGYLSDDMRSAIDSDNDNDNDNETEELVARLIRKAVETQPANNVIEGVGNRMLVRDFLHSQRGKLALYEEYLAEEQTEPEGRIRKLFNSIDSDLENAKELVARYKDVSGGVGVERFRQAINNDDDKAVVDLVRHMANMNVSDVLAMGDPQEVMKYVRDSIVELLWDAIQDYREDGNNINSNRNLRNMVAYVVRDIDGKISGSMLQ